MVLLAWEFLTAGLSLYGQIIRNVLFLRSTSVYRIDLWTEVAALNSQVVPISQVVLKVSLYSSLHKMLPPGNITVLQQCEILERDYAFY